MSQENNTSKCISCTCTGCNNFKDNAAKEASLNTDSSDDSKTSKR